MYDLINSFQHLTIDLVKLDLRDIIFGMFHNICATNIFVRLTTLKQFNLMQFISILIFVCMIGFFESLTRGICWVWSYIIGTIGWNASAWIDR